LGVGSTGDGISSVKYWLQWYCIVVISDRSRNRRVNECIGISNWFSEKRAKVHRWNE
jgi:hypothetical protein